jgi:hypothetical protein
MLAACQHGLTASTLLSLQILPAEAKYKKPSDWDETSDQHA